jgi:hypothetical protein
MFKDDRFRDNPPPPDDDAHPMRDYFGQQHVWDQDRPEVHEIIRGWRRLLDRHGERTMVGEVYLMEPAKVAAYHGAALDELPLAFNFAFKWTPWDAALFRQRVEEVERLWPAGAQPTYVLSSHDAPRHRTRFDDAAAGAARARVAALMMLTLRGTPFLYYGEELGMRDGEIRERICDPVGQRFPPSAAIPSARRCRGTLALAGFSTADPGCRSAAVADRQRRRPARSGVDVVLLPPRHLVAEVVAGRARGACGCSMGRRHVRIRARARRAARGRRAQLHVRAGRMPLPCPAHRLATRMSRRADTRVARRHRGGGGARSGGLRPAPRNDP